MSYKNTFYHADNLWAYFTFTPFLVFTDISELYSFIYIKLLSYYISDGHCCRFATPRSHYISLRIRFFMIEFRKLTLGATNERIFL